MAGVRKWFSSLGITEHRLFLVAVALKAIDGAMELCAGITEHFNFILLFLTCIDGLIVPTILLEYARLRRSAPLPDLHGSPIFERSKRRSYGFAQKTLVPGTTDVFEIIGGSGIPTGRLAGLLYGFLHRTVAAHCGSCRRVFFRGRRHDSSCRLN